jgi:MFS family permease
MEIRRSDPWTVTGVVSGGHFLSHLYILTFPPLFPLLRAEFELTNAELGLVFSLVSLAPIFLQLPFGGLVDRIGGKRVFVLGILSTALGTAAVGFAESYATLLAFAFVAGIGQSTFHPADFALLDAISDDTTRGKSFGVHTFAGYSGFAVAPVLVGGLGVLYGWRLAVIVAGATGVVYALFAYLLLDDVHLRLLDAPGERTSEWTSIRDGLRLLLSRELLLLFAFFTLITMPSAGFQAFTTVFVGTLGFGTATGNAVLTTFLTFTALGVLVGGVLADALEIHRVIAVTIGGAAVVTWLIASGALVLGPVALFGLFAVVGALNGLALPSRDGLVTEVASARETGRSFGFVYSGASTALFVTPVLLGALIDLTAASYAVVAIGGFYACAVIVVGALGSGVLADE